MTLNLGDRGGKQMDGRERVLKDLSTSVETWNLPLMEDRLGKALSMGLTPGEIIDDGLSRGMEVIGDRFGQAEIYLPQVLAASRVMERALVILEPLMAEGKGHKGVIVFGTVKGDIHEIGKNVCCAMLRGAGYKVIDLGTDVSPQIFVDIVKKANAKILGCSALMTTTLIIQREVVKAVREENLPILTIFGGAPCSRDWVDKIGGDGYSSSGNEIVPLVARLLQKEERK
jgi:corrinoid protein of di/trimethylamine methyltransferase